MIAEDVTELIGNTPLVGLDTFVSNLVVTTVQDFGERYLSTDLYEPTGITHGSGADPGQPADDLQRRPDAPAAD